MEIHSNSDDNMMRNLISVTSNACLSKCQEDPALCASYFEMLHRYYVFKPVVLYEFKNLPEIIIMSSKFVCTDDRIISRSVLRFLTSILRLTKRTRKDVTQRCVANACSILIQSVVSGIVSTCPAANFKLLGQLLFVLVKDYSAIVLSHLSDVVMRHPRIVYDKTTVPVRKEEREWFIKAVMKFGRNEKTNREFVSLVSDFCGVCRRTKEGSVLKEWVNGDTSIY